MSLPYFVLADTKTARSIVDELLLKRIECRLRCVDGIDG